MKFLFRFKKVIFFGCLMVVLSHASLSASPLLSAINMRDIEKIKQLLSKGFLGLEIFKTNINEKNEAGSTPLHIAVRDNYEPIVRLLLEHGADVNAREKTGDSPLHWSARSCYSHNITALLLDYGARIDAQDKYGSTPLHIAAEKGHEALARLLLERGASLNVQANNGWTPLHVAAKEGKEAVIQLLIEQGTAKDSQCKSGWTPLHWAIQYGKNTAVQVLLEHGAATEIQNKDGSTPLHIAAANGKNIIAQLLLEHGADVNARESDGATPLHVAADKKNHKTMILLLLKHSANPTSQTLRGLTPDKIARLYEHYELANILSKAAASYQPPAHNPTSQVSESETDQHETAIVRVESVLPIDTPTGTLHGAVQKNDIEKVKQLLSISSINVNERDHEGATPLHDAASKGYESVARLLLDRGADTTAQTTEIIKNETLKIIIPAGATPADVARLCNRAELADLLQAATSPTHPSTPSQAGPAANLDKADGSAKQSDQVQLENMHDFGFEIESDDPIALASVQRNMKRTQIDMGALGVCASFVKEWQQELYAVAQREQRFAITRREQYVLLGHSNTNVTDYYEVLWSLLSDTLLACKTMHSGQVANGFENNFETAAKIIGAARNIPVVNQFTELLRTILGFVAETQKKHAVTRLATLVHTVGEIDMLTEEIARHLTQDVRMQELCTLPTPKTSSIQERFKKQWHYLCAEEFTTDAKKRAQEDAYTIIRAVAKDSEEKLGNTDLEILKLNLLKCVDPDYAATEPTTAHAQAQPVVFGTAAMGSTATTDLSALMATAAPSPHEKTTAQLETEVQRLKEGAISAATISRLEKELAKLKKRVDGQDAGAIGDSQLLVPRGAAKVNGGKQDHRDQQLAEHEEQLALHAALLASMREHPDFQHLQMHDTGSVPQAKLLCAAISAFERDNIQELSFTLEKGLDLNTQGGDNNNLFHLAALHGAHNSMKSILAWVSQKKVSAVHLLTATNAEGKTPIDLLDTDDIEALNIGTELSDYIKVERGKGRVY